MPTISMFFGIVIRMYYDDHNPPHFHAYYNDAEAIFSIDTLEVLAGRLPKRANAMVIEWASEHRKELMEDWMLAYDHYPLKQITPLE